MPTVNEVYEYLKRIAPEEMALETDNVGFLVGKINAIADNILVSLDITDDVISEASEKNATLIIAHHPLFKTLTSVTDKDKTGQKIVRMLTEELSAICMHTNLDAAHDGVNDTLAELIGTTHTESKAEPLPDHKCTQSGEIISYGRVGLLKNPCTVPEYLEFLKEALDANGFRYYDSGRKVHKIASVAGGGGDEWDKAIKSGCDTFITADIKYKLFLDAKDHNINLIDGGHFCTENPVIKTLANKLRSTFPDATVTTSEIHKQIQEFY